MKRIESIAWQIVAAVLLTLAGMVVWPWRARERFRDLPPDEAVRRHPSRFAPEIKERRP